jgi:ABC-type maltose transport system permease subunit
VDFFEGVHVDRGAHDGAAVLMTVPLAMLFVFVQRHLVAGMGVGGIKG